MEVTHELIRVEAPFDMPEIKVPVFPDNNFRIDDYGAIEGGAVKNTEAIKKAINACVQAGGGKVIIPEGKWLTAKIHLQSNVNLHLEDGAELIFSDDPSDYLPAVQTTWEGMECFNYSPLIYAFECDNVAITGNGTLRPLLDTWKIWYARPPEHMEALKQLYHMGSTDVPVEERQMAKGNNNLRPHFIQFNRCNHVRVENIKIRHSPFWTVHLFKSSHILVRGIDVYAHGHNNDGVGPEMVKNVLIEDCRFDQGDDAIDIKSGRNRDGWRLNTPAENIVIRNCTFLDGHQLVAIGSELSGGVRNVYIHDCDFPLQERKTELRNLLYIKTNRRRGGFVENIFMENIKAGNLTQGVLGIETDVLYQWRDIVPTYEERLTPIKGVYINNIQVMEANIPFRILGDPEMPVKDISISNIRVDKVIEKNDELVNVEKIQFTDIWLNGIQYSSE